MNDDLNKPRSLRAARGPVLRLVGRRSTATTFRDLEAPLLERLEREGVTSLLDVRSSLGEWILPELDEVEPVHLSPTHVARIVAAADASSRSLGDRAKWILGRLFDTARELELVDADAIDPVRTVKMKRPPRPGRDRARVEVLSLAEMRAMISDERLSLTNRRLWALCLLTGVRIGEASELRVENVHDLRPLRALEISQSWKQKARVVGRTKTGATRIVPIHPLLEELLPKEGLLAPPRARRPRWLERAALSAWRRDLKTLGLPGRRLHATRHTFISQLLRAHADREAVRSFTHARATKIRDPFDFYAHLDWRATCEELLRLQLPPPAPPAPPVEQTGFNFQPQENLQTSKGRYGDEEDDQEEG